MKILIAYTSKNGTTAGCVRRLAKHLQGLDVTLADLSVTTPNVSDFDLAIVGASVRYARLDPALRRLLRDQREALLQVPLALFLVCGLAHEYEYYEEVLLPRELREHAFSVMYLGGSLRKDGLPLWDRLIVSSLRSRIMESEIEDGEYTPSLPGILPESIERLATYARQRLNAAPARQNGENNGTKETP